MGTPFSPSWFRNIFDPRRMQQESQTLQPFDPEEEDWIRYGRAQSTTPPGSPLTLPPGVPDLSKATPYKPPVQPPHETVKYGPTEYDPSLMYPSPTGETWTPNNWIDPKMAPGYKPPPPVSPQSRPTAATGKLAPMKPMKSSQDLWPERIDTPVEDDTPVPGLRRGNNQPVTGTPDHVPSYWYGYPEQYTSDLPKATQNSPNNFMGQPYVGAGDSEEAQAKEINEVLKYVPKHEWNDRLLAMLDNMPQRNQDMSKWRKFGSFLTGFGLGPEAQEKATYAPYYRDLADWRMRLDPTLKGADMERQENINLRQLQAQTENARIADRRAAAYEDSVIGANKKREADIARDQAKNRISERLAADKNWVFKTDKASGHIIGMHPSQGTWDTGVMANEATPEQKHLWKLDEIQEAGNQRRLSAAAAAKLGRPGDVEIKESMDPNTGITKFWAVSKLPPYKATPVRANASGELDIEETPEAPPPSKPILPHFNPATGGTPPGSKQIASTKPRVVEEEPSDYVPEEEEGDDQLTGKGPSGSQNMNMRKTRASQIVSRMGRYGKMITTDRNTGLPYVKQHSSFMGYDFGGPTQAESDVLNDILDGKITVERGMQILNQGQGSPARPQGATNRGQMKILGSGKKVWVEP